MKRLILVLVVVGILLIGTAGVLAAYVFNWIDFSGSKGTGGSGSGGMLRNPTEGLTDEQAAMMFDESFVYYILASIKAYELHNPPFSSDTPKINFYVGDDVYNAEIIGGKISVAEGEIGESDVVIRTSKIEAVKMARDKSYVVQSFGDGNSRIELIAGKTELAMKGYLSLMSQFG